MELESKRAADRRVASLAAAKAAADRNTRDAATATADKLLGLNTVEYVDMWTGPHGQAMHTNRRGTLS